MSLLYDHYADSLYGRLIEVDYVDGTEVYAITIEPEGGSESPTFENLIGTVSVAGI